MRIYGYTGSGKTKSFDLGFEDVLAIQDGARKSSIGKIKNKTGEYKSYTRSSRKRKLLRIYYKRAFRQQELKKLDDEILKTDY